MGAILFWTDMKCLLNWNMVSSKFNFLSWGQPRNKSIDKFFLSVLKMGLRCKYFFGNLIFALTARTLSRNRLNVVWTFLALGWEVEHMHTLAQFVFGLCLISPNPPYQLWCYGNHSRCLAIVLKFYFMAFQAFVLCHLVITTSTRPRNCQVLWKSEKSVLWKFQFFSAFSGDVSSNSNITIILAVLWF